MHGQRLRGTNSAQKDKHEWPENQAKMTKTAAARNDMWTVYQTAKNLLVIPEQKVD